MLNWCFTEVLKSTDDLMRYLKMCDATPAPFGLFKHAEKSKVSLGVIDLVPSCENHKIIDRMFLICGLILSNVCLVLEELQVVFT